MSDLVYDNDREEILGQLSLQGGIAAVARHGRGSSLAAPQAPAAADAGRRVQRAAAAARVRAAVAAEEAEVAGGDAAEERDIAAAIQASLQGHRRSSSSHNTAAAAAPRGRLARRRQQQHQGQQLAGGSASGDGYAADAELTLLLVATDDLADSDGGYSPVSPLSPMSPRPRDARAPEAMPGRSVPHGVRGGDNGDMVTSSDLRKH